MLRRIRTVIARVAGSVARGYFPGDPARRRCRVAGESGVRRWRDAVGHGRRRGRRWCSAWRCPAAARRSPGRLRPARPATTPAARRRHGRSTDDHLGVQPARRSGQRRPGAVAGLRADPRPRIRPGLAERRIGDVGIPSTVRRQLARPGVRPAHRQEPLGASVGRDRTWLVVDEPPDHRAGVLRTAADPVLLRDDRVRARAGDAAAVLGAHGGELPVQEHGRRVRRAGRPGVEARGSGHGDGRWEVRAVHRAAGDRHHRPGGLPARRAVRRHQPDPVPRRPQLERQARLHLRRRLQRRATTRARAPAAWSTTCSWPRGTRWRRRA